MTPAKSEDSLPRQVLSFIRRRELVSPKETLLVGVSGGQDSVCLLHILAGLQEKLDVGLHVAHLNHMLRGHESDADAEYVLGLAHRLGIGATVGQERVRDYRREHRLTLEEAAREVRYAFFGHVASRVGAAAVAVGHTADDQVETILMRLLRGAGTLGLQGMQPAAERDVAGGEGTLRIVRPLLEVGRDRTASYCRQHGLMPRKDSSNVSPSHLRNRIRSELIPLLRSYNPRIDETLLRTSDTLGLEMDYFRKQVQLLWDRVVREEDASLIINATALERLHPALQRYLLREVVQRVLGSLKDIEWNHIEQLRKAIDLPRGKRVSLPRGLVFEVEKGWYRVSVT